MLSRTALSLQPDLTYLTPQIKVGRISVIMLLLELFYQFLCSGKDGIVPHGEKSGMEIGRRIRDGGRCDRIVV
jgi:hypothetical protein